MDNPEKIIAPEDLWLKKVTEMSDEGMHEAQSYKMSQNLRHFQQSGLQGASVLYKKLCLRHSHARTN